MDNDTTLYCIYRIVCFTTGKCYVGQTNNPRLRKTTHFSKLKNNTHYNGYLQAAYNKYGASSFYFEILETDISKSAINSREIYWIDYICKSCELYNLTPGGFGGNGAGRPCTWNGVEYRSVAEAARANNMVLEKMQSRIRKGYMRDSDVVDLQKPVIWNGIEYKSQSEAARNLKITRERLRYYIAQGYVCDEDIGKFVTGKLCSWNGIQYLTVKAAATANGIEHATLCNYIKRGYQCDADIPRKRHKLNS